MKSNLRGKIILPLILLLSVYCASGEKKRDEAKEESTRAEEAAELKIEQNVTPEDNSVNPQKPEEVKSETEKVEVEEVEINPKDSPYEIVNIAASEDLYSVVISDDRKTIITGDEAGNLNFRFKSGIVYKTIKIGQKTITHLVKSGDNKLYLALLNEEKICIFDSEGDIVKELSYAKVISNIAFSSDSKYVLFLDADKKVKSWDYETDQVEEANVPSYFDRIEFSKDSKLLFGLNSNPEEYSVWEIEGNTFTKRNVFPKTKNQNFTYDVISFSSNNEIIIFASKNDTIGIFSIWNTKGKKIRDFKTNFNYCNVNHTDEDSYCTGDFFTSIDIADNADIFAISDNIGAIHTYNFAGKRIKSFIHDPEKIRKSDIQGRTKRWLDWGQISSVKDIKFFPGNKDILSIGKGLKAWNFEKETLFASNGYELNYPIMDIVEKKGEITLLGLSNSGLYTWNLKNNKKQVLKGSSKYAQMAKMSPDGSLIISKVDPYGLDEYNLWNSKGDLVKKITFTKAELRNSASNNFKINFSLDSSKFILTVAAERAFLFDAKGNRLHAIPQRADNGYFVTNSHYAIWSRDEKLLKIFDLKHKFVNQYRPQIDIEQLKIQAFSNASIAFIGDYYAQVQILSLINGESKSLAFQKSDSTPSPFYNIQDDLLYEILPDSFKVFDYNLKEKETISGIGTLIKKSVSTNLMLTQINSPNGKGIAFRQDNEIILELYWKDDQFIVFHKDGFFEFENPSMIDQFLVQTGKANEYKSLSEFKGKFFKKNLLQDTLYTK